MGRGGQQCAAYGCDNRLSCRFDSKTGTKICFHRFPRIHNEEDKKRVKLWLVHCSDIAVDEKELKNLWKSRFLCSMHFEGRCYYNKDDKISSRLYSHAVPTVFEFVEPKKRTLLIKDLPGEQQFNVDNFIPIKEEFTISVEDDAQFTHSMDTEKDLKTDGQVGLSDKDQQIKLEPNDDSNLTMKMECLTENCGVEDEWISRLDNNPINGDCSKTHLSKTRRSKTSSNKGRDCPWKEKCKMLRAQNQKLNRNVNRLRKRVNRANDRMKEIKEAAIRCNVFTRAKSCDVESSGIDNLPEKARNFVKSQIEYSKVKRQGVRWDEQTIEFALELDKTSPAGYAFLSNIFALPCKTVLYNRRQAHLENRQATMSSLDSLSKARNAQITASENSMVYLATQPSPESDENISVQNGLALKKEPNDLQPSPTNLHACREAHMQGNSRRLISPKKKTGRRHVILKFVSDDD